MTVMVIAQPTLNPAMLSVSTTINALLMTIIGGVGTLIGPALGGIVTGVSALLARYTECGKEGAVYGLDNSINSGARALAPMIGVSIAVGLGFRAVFSAISLLYLIAAVLALWGLPRIVACRISGQEA